MSRARMPGTVYAPGMKEPGFSDAACYGKEFDAKSRICGVCLGRNSCQRIFYKSIGASRPPSAPAGKGFPGPLPPPGVVRPRRAHSISL